MEGFDQDQAEDLVRGMALKFDADQAVWDIARVLRMPGFRNHKYQELRHFVKDVHENPSTGKAYRQAEFPRLPVCNQPMMVAKRKQLAIVSNFSQSERDWAFVMRELRLGTNPQTLRLHLEQTRADKRNPRYYAQRTVARALMERSAAQSPITLLPVIYHR